MEKQNSEKITPARKRIRTALTLVAVALMGLSLHASAIEGLAEKAKPAIEMGIEKGDDN